VLVVAEPYVPNPPADVLATVLRTLFILRAVMLWLRAIEVNAVIARAFLEVFDTENVAARIAAATHTRSSRLSTLSFLRFITRLLVLRHVGVEPLLPELRDAPSHRRVLDETMSRE
jgi:hypothetical protein